MIYLLDSDVLMAAKNSHYAFDIVPGFWAWVKRAHQAGKLFVVEKVADEIRAGGDELAEWLDHQPGSFVIRAGAADVAALTRVAQWATGAGYRAGAIPVFLAAADYYEVAPALTHGATVVTNEKAEPLARKRIKIPDACAAIGVPCMNLFEVMRAEKAQL